MKQLYTFCMWAVTLSGLAQNPILLQHIWHLDKIVMDEVEYVADPSGNLSDITLRFEATPQGTYTAFAIACNTGMGELVFPEPGTFSLSSLFNWTLINCNNPVDASMDSLYQSFFSGQVNAMGPYEYTLQTDEAGNPTLVITAVTGMQAFYHSEPDPGVEILTAYTWLLDHLVMEGEEYYTPDALLGEANLLFQYNDPGHYMSVSACSGGAGEVFFPGNSIVQIPFGLAWLQLTCPIPELVNFSILHTNLYSHSGDYSYVLNDISDTCNGCPLPAYELALYSPVGNVAYYYNQSLGTDAFAHNRLVVYPNPASDVLHVPTDAGDQIMVHDLTGRQLAQTTAADAETILDVAAFPAGVYLVSVQSDKGTKQARFVKR